MNTTNSFDDRTDRYFVASEVSLIRSTFLCSAGVKCLSSRLKSPEQVTPGCTNKLFAACTSMLPCLHHLFASFTSFVNLSFLYIFSGVFGLEKKLHNCCFCFLPPRGQRFGVHDGRRLESCRRGFESLPWTAKPDGKMRNYVSCSRVVVVHILYCILSQITSLIRGNG